MISNKQPRLLITNLLLMLAALLISSCASRQTPTPLPTVIYPAASAPVQITVLSPDQFAVTNHTLAPIYYQLFPTELLPLIDWASCESPAACQDVQILPEASISFPFSTIKDKGSESISLFWWHIFEDQGQPNPDYFSPQHIEIPIP